MYEEEYLAHYGVKGMKWGIRRTPEQLGNRINKLSRTNEQLKADSSRYIDKARTYMNKSVSMKEHNSKYEKRIAKATAKKGEI